MSLSADVAVAGQPARPSTGPERAARRFPLTGENRIAKRLDALRVGARITEKTS
jgi:hypothetical protein